MKQILFFLLICVFVPLLADNAVAQPVNSTSTQTESSPANKPVQEEFFQTIGVPILTSVVTYGGQKLMDKMLDWVFADRSDLPEPASSDPQQGPRPPPDYAKTGLPVGIAYRLYRIDKVGAPVRVSPSVVFLTGDQIIIKFTTNLPGIVSIENLDADLEKQDLGVWRVAGGEAIDLGPFEFYGTPGVDVITLRLCPCLPGDKEYPQDIRERGESQNVRRLPIREAALSYLAPCAPGLPGLLEKPVPGIKESLRRVDDKMVYSVTHVDPANLKQGDPVPVVTKISVQHH
jgi:hypothetical protein